MTKTVRAIFENGVFKPTGKIELPERTEVEFEPRIVEGESDRDATLQATYEILSESYDTGDPGLSSRHNEHQP